MLFDVLPQHSPLPNLVTMKLYSNPWSESELGIGCLPELPALRSLILTPHSRIESPTPLRLLSTSSLSHIHLKSWPSPTFLDSLPRTAELLNFDLNGDRFDKDANARWYGPMVSEQDLLAEVEDVKSWKLKRFPALRALRIRDGRARSDLVDRDGRQRLPPRVTERIESLTLEVKALRS